MRKNCQGSADWLGYILVRLRWYFQQLNTAQFYRLPSSSQDDGDQTQVSLLLSRLVFGNSCRFTAANSLCDLRSPIAIFLDYYLITVGLGPCMYTCYFLLFLKLPPWVRFLLSKLSHLKSRFLDQAATQGNSRWCLSFLSALGWLIFPDRCLYLFSWDMKHLNN